MIGVVGGLTQKNTNLNIIANQQQPVSSQSLLTNLSISSGNSNYDMMAQDWNGSRWPGLRALTAKGKRKERKKGREIVITLGAE